MKPYILDISDPEKAMKWTLVHMAIGAITTVTPWFFVIYFYAVFFLNMGNAWKAVRKGNIALFALTFSYLLSFEMLARITKSYPFVPTEYVKYFMVSIGLYTLYQSPRKANRVGMTMLLLLVPALLFDMSGMRVWVDVVNCVFGGLALAVGVALFGSYTPSDALIARILRLMWLALVSVLVNVFIKTPDLEELEFTVKAMTTTTGGASSNQASTILGMGVFLSFYSLYSGQTFSSRRVLDIVFLLLFTYQCLLTFSRGGFVVAVIAIIMMIFTTRSALKTGGGKGGGFKASSLVYLLLGAMILFGAYNIIDKASGGKLTMRYQGETDGTAAGYAEKDVNRMTSGRSTIFEEDIMIFEDFPLFGGGAGSSIHLRAEEKGVIPHIEFSRMLAEHGVLGIVYFALLLWLGWMAWESRKKVSLGNLLFILYTIGLLTSFHSAMRTFVTPFLIALSSMGLATVKKKTG